MEVFNGELYLGTENYNSGFELWKTADGVTFTSVVDSLFNTLSTVAKMKTSGGKLWILAKNSTDDFKVYSYDGTVFVLENGNEFGANDLDINYNVAMESFDNHLYIGVTNFFMPARYAAPKDGIMASPNTSGGQIWRACMTGVFPNVDITNSNPSYICEGNNIVLNSTGDAVSYVWSNGAVSSSINVSDTGDYALTGVAANGCRYSDFARVTYFPLSQPPIFTMGQNPNPVMGIALCNGDSSPVITSRHPDNDFNAVVFTGANPGFETPANPVFASDLDLTIEFWMKPSGDGVIVSEFDTLSTSTWTNNNYGLIFFSGGSVYVNIPGSSTSSLYIGYAPYNQWSHIALRYNAAGGVLDGLVNGSVSSSDIRLREIPENFGGYDAYKFGIESFAPFYNQSFNGRIRDVRIWSSPRTDNEIQSNMNGLPGGIYPDLVYYYKTQELSGSVLNDSSGNNFNAGIVGSAYFAIPQTANWVASPGLSILGNGQALLHPSANATFTSTYVDGNGCLAQPGSLLVDVYYIDLLASSSASCGGDPVYLSIGTNAPLNNPLWQSNSLGSVNTYSLSATPGSSEWIYLSDSIAGGSCVIKDSVMINVGPALTYTINTQVPVFGCADAGKWFSLGTVGGTAPFTYYWNFSNGLDSSAVDSIFHIMPNAFDEMSVSAIDAIGCGFNTSIIVQPISSTNLLGHVTTPAPANVDNGFVYLFKHQPGNAGFDTVAYTNLDANGTYLFSPLVAGNYLIKALPDETAFPLAVPTYYGNAFQWDSSLVFNHGCSQNDTADIQVVVSTTNITGPGSISGYIIEGDGFGTNRLFGGITQPNLPFAPGGPLKGVDVKLGKNPGGGIQARTMSDSTGFYVFDSLPVGGYKIYVDIPNLPMDSTREITISGADSSVQNNYFADSASVYINPDTVSTVGIYSTTKQYENKFIIYPNPAKGAMYISYELKESSSVGFEIINSMGQRIKSEPFRKYPEGKNIFVFNTDQLNLQDGVYFISIITNGTKYTQRIVVID